MLNCRSGPLLFRGQRNLVLSSILDIAHEKSLAASSASFSTIMNAVTGIKGLHDIIALELGARYGSELELLQGAIENIRDIIESHKDFSLVEHGNTLGRLQFRDPRCSPYWPPIARLHFRGRKQLAVDATSTNSVCSDVRLVQRILVNMIKNA